MKILRWNYKELMSPRVLRALKRLIRNENPTLIFLMETHLKDGELQVIKYKFDFEHVFTLLSVLGMEEKGWVV